MTAWTSGGASTGESDQVSASSTSLPAALGGRLVVGQHARDDACRRPRSSPIADEEVDADRRGRSRPPCAAAPRRRRRPRGRPPRRRRPASQPSRPARTSWQTGALRQQRRVVDDPRVAALGLDEAPEALERRAARERRARQLGAVLAVRRRGRRARPCARRARRRASAKRPVRSPRRTSIASRTSLALPTASASGWLMSVISAPVARPLSSPSATHSSASSRASLEVLHERPRAGLDVEQDRVGAAGQLLAHHARGDQRDVVDRRGDVAQRVHRLVGRHEVGRLRAHREADRLDLGDQLVAGQLGAHARDRVELVERAAGVPEPAAGELDHLHAELGRERRDDERRAVADAAGRVLVDGRAGQRARGRARRPRRPSRRSARPPRRARSR